MLRFLSIERLAIIDSLAIEFAPGFNVLTGETGAGKSIVVGAIELLLGGRATAELVRTGSETAVVQGCMETVDNKEVIVRREISTSGRSRAFIDDTLVTAATLRSVMTPLIDLHGQHDHQQLLDPAGHIHLLDAFIDATAEREAVEVAWKDYADAQRAVATLTMDERERLARLEMARFQLSEIQKVAPEPEEDDRLAAERIVRQNAERLRQLSAHAYEELYDDEVAAMTRLARVWRDVEQLAALDPRWQGHLVVREAVAPALEDLAFALRKYHGEVDAPPERLQVVEDRLASIERLKRKYGPSLADVIEHGHEFESTVQLLERASENKAELEARAASARAAFLVAASVLSARRRAGAPKLSARVEAELADLAMERARCAFQFEACPDHEEQWGSLGFDTGEFVFSANPGEALRPLARIASGGELSRVMLALKSVASTDQPGKTLVFDEVDTGISGRVADTVGRRLRTLGKRFQVISVTHLPQVAAYATAHFSVAKRIADGRSRVVVAKLDEASRSEDLGRLLAGPTVTPAVLETARELIRHAGESESNSKGESESPRRGTRAKGAR
jgi:DNA repair protein RecN (Recombination protein N)